MAVNAKRGEGSRKNAHEHNRSVTWHIQFARGGFSLAPVQNHCHQRGETHRSVKEETDNNGDGATKMKCKFDKYLK